MSHIFIYVNYMNCMYCAEAPEGGTTSSHDIGPTYDVDWSEMASVDSTGIDAIYVPGPVGLFAVGWDDLNTAVPTSFYIRSDLLSAHQPLISRNSS
jgi:hypothetical protein